MDTQTPPSIHPFERCGLGKAPYRFAGYEKMTYQACHGAPIQPGGSCDYCGTAIMDAFWIRSKDGKQFKVGSDCIFKLYRECAKTDQERSMRALYQRVLDAKREQAHLSADKRAERAGAILDAHWDELVQVVRPSRYLGKPDSNVAHWADWMLRNAGRKGKTEVARELERIAQERGWEAV